MIKKKSLLTPYVLGCFITLFASATLADENIAFPVPDDFAFGMQVLTNNDNAFQAIVLPDHYYQHVARQDGRDLRVFNAEGLALPFTISRHKQEQAETKLRKLPIFPIYGQSQSELNSLNLRVERNASGTIIDIKEGLGQQSDSGIIAYIVDNSESQTEEMLNRLSAFEFEWSEPEYGFVDAIKIEHSSDLKKWRTLTSKESLSKLAYEDEVIGKKIIAVQKEADKFLRISWNTQIEFKLSEMVARYQWKEHIEKLHWHTVKQIAYVNNVSEDDPAYGAYRFTINGHAPIQRFTIDFNSENAFYRGKLYSRPDSTSRWLDRGRFLQYKLKMPGGEIQSEPLHLQPVRDSEWLIRFDTPKELRSELLPGVKLAWYPEQLTFLAQGSQPFTLAYGNPRVEPADSDLNSLLNTLNDEQRAEIVKNVAGLDEVTELGGLSRLDPAAKKLPWRAAVLWFVLIVGVLIMSSMAVSLYKQIGSKKALDEED